MKVTKRRGRWVVDAYVHGKRLVPSFRTKREAEDRKKELEKEREQKTRPAVNPFITLRDYTPRFLSDCENAELAASSMRTYTGMLENHIIPRLGDRHYGSKKQRDTHERNDALHVATILDRRLRFTR